MQILKRITVPVAVLVLAVLIAGTVLAGKHVFRARISGDGARGTAILGTNVDGSGWDFSVFVRNVNNSTTEVWLADPDLDNELPLCGVLGAAEAECTHDEDGNLSLDGSLTSGVAALWDWRGSEFMDALKNERMQILVYHGGGVSSGVFIQIFP